MVLVNNQKGAILLMLLVVVSILGLAAGIAGSSWKTITMQAKEKELLWCGGQIRKAIESYYLGGSTSTQSMLPATLDDLLRDSRSAAVVRHLRQKYIDPVTGDDWVVINTSDGLIMGVRSSSKEKPFKQGNFKVENEKFIGTSSYTEWEFIFNPSTTKKTSMPVVVNPATNATGD